VAEFGVQVRVVSTGPYKGLGIPGTPLTEAYVDEVQHHIDQVGHFFFAAVQRGRRLQPTQLAAVSDGRLWIAAEAKQLGLIDAIQTFDQALAMALDTRPVRQTAARAELSRLRTALTFTQGA
jgi:ClpP class serine protease